MNTAIQSTWQRQGIRLFLSFLIPGILIPTVLIPTILLGLISVM